MQLFIYARSASPKETHLIRDIRQTVPYARLEVFPTAQGLSARLLKPRDTFSVAILFAPTKEDLQSLIPLRDFFRETKILLILSGQDKETLCLAHRLFPTYVSYTENHHDGILSVLQNLIDAHQKASVHGSIED